MRPEQRARLLEQMLKILRLSGQAKRWPRLARAKADAWDKLSQAQRATTIILCQSRAAKPGGVLEIAL